MTHSKHPDGSISSAKNQRGVTLAECMIALALLGIAVISIAGLIAQQG